ncbi:hypothetical protein R0G64_31690, partial [Pseudomonas otitidis]
GYAWLSGWAFSLAASALPLGMGSTLLVGLFFGLYPAVSASASPAPTSARLALRPWNTTGAL